MTKHLHAKSVKNKCNGATKGLIDKLNKDSYTRGDEFHRHYLPSILVLIKCYFKHLAIFKKTILGHNKTTLPARDSNGPLFYVDLLNHQNSIFVVIIQLNYNYNPIA